MEIYLKERIGYPELFTGRKEDMLFFLKWIEEIKEKKSKSTAILARRKMGKTALLERLFNITFERNDGIIPFYYEVKEEDQWAIDFAKDFFLTFLSQYLAFKIRDTLYLRNNFTSFPQARKKMKKEGFDFFLPLIDAAQEAEKKGRVGELWQIARKCPRNIAQLKEEPIVQMIDEFQFLNSYIYRDEDCKNLYGKFTGGYLSDAESKVAPLLISGGWVGWLMHDLDSRLPARFKKKFLRNLPEEEAIEMIF